METPQESVKVEDVANVVEKQEKPNKIKKDNKTFKLQIRINNFEKNMINEMRQLDENFSISTFIREAFLKAYNVAKAAKNNTSLPPSQSPQ